jgi:Ni/Fe-hydrogenase 1 B-type cytochrome subunit
MKDSISRVAVFNSNHRWTHWLIAFGVIFELVSAWLIQHSNVDVIAWSDWHSMVGQVLLLLLVYRVFLLFQQGSGHWRLLVPTREQRHIIAQTLKFYVSLGRMPCPDWYAFNPLWQPVYLIMIFILLFTGICGFFIGSYLFPFGFSLTEIHAFSSSIILYFTLAHIAFSMLHDARGKGGQISAMLNGYKYFHIKDRPVGPEETSVSLDSLLKK